MSFATDLNLTYPSSDQVRRMNSGLSDKLHANELTVRDLQEAIMAIHEVNGEVRSVGIEFIKYYRNGIESVASAMQLTELYLDNVDNPAITAVITVHELFDMLDTNLTEQLVRDITSRHAMPDCTWIRTAGVSYGGVSRETIYEAIMAQLDEGRFTLEESRPFAESFLQHGSGSHVVPSRMHVDVDENPYFELTDTSAIWCAVPTDKFYDVVERCICRAPEAMFMPSRNDNPDLQLCLAALRPDTNVVHFMPYTSSLTSHQMLSTADIIKLRDQAAPWLATLKDLSMDMLLKLPLAQQKTIVESCLPGSLEFLVRATLHLDYYNESQQDQETRFAFFKSYVNRLSFNGAEALAAYRAVHSHLAHLMDPMYEQLSTVAKQVDEMLKELLTEHGYFIGTVSCVRSAQHGLQSIIRMKVGGSMLKIIQNGRQERLRRFSDGDLVLADSNTDKRFAEWLNKGKTLLFADLHYVDETRERCHI